MDSFGRKILVTRNRVRDTTKYKHLWAYQTGSMREPSFWQPTLSFNFLDPFHVLNIESSDLIVVNFILEVRCAIVSSEEYKHHIIKYARLLFFFWWELPKDSGRDEPCGDCSVKRVIILKYSVADASKNNHFIAISGHTMKRSSGRQNFFHICIGKLMNINLNQRVNKLPSGFSFNIQIKSYLQKYKSDPQWYTWSVLKLFCKKAHCQWQFFPIRSFCRWYFFVLSKIV